MIKAIIVDDEMLIRKGLIMTLPWQKYGIEIIGEASNGSAALEFISNNEVDLLITDITMPVMSGMDLMEVVLYKYPHIHVVLITCHQDFEYIQTALRMGAIDYIVKTQIEDDKIEESLERISKIINSARISIKSAGSESSAQTSIKNTGMLLLPFNINEEGSIPVYLEWLQEELRVNIAGNSFFYLVADEDYLALEQSFIKEQTLNEWLLVRIRNIHAIEKNQLAGFIKHYESNRLFYECDPGNRLYEANAVNDKVFDAEVDYNDYLQLKNDWSNVLCVFNKAEYDRLKSLTLEMHPDSSKAKSLFYKAAVEWESSLQIQIPEAFFEVLESARAFSSSSTVTIILFLPRL